VSHIDSMYKNAAPASVKDTCWDALKHCGCLCRLDMLGTRSRRTTSSDE